jgi:hypothetical protein
VHASWWGKAEGTHVLQRALTWHMTACRLLVCSPLTVLVCRPVCRLVLLAAVHQHLAGTALLQLFLAGLTASMNRQQQQC